MPRPTANGLPAARRTPHIDSKREPERRRGGICAIIIPNLGANFVPIPAGIIFGNLRTELHFLAPPSQYIFGSSSRVASEALFSRPFGNLLSRPFGRALAKASAGVRVEALPN